MAREPSTLNTWLIALAAALEERGLDARSLFAEAGLPPEVLNDAGGRHPISGMARVFRLAVERSGDPAIGLGAARFVQPTTFHGLGLAILASDTLADAMRRGARYSRVISDAIDLVTEETDEGLWQNLRPRAGVPLVPEAIDLYLAGTLTMGRLLTGTDIRAKRLRRSHSPSPAMVEQYRRVFTAPVEFDAGVDGFMIDHETANRPLPMANPALALANDEAVRAPLAAIEGSRHVDRVREVVIARLSSGEPDREDVARALGLGEKTLQRRLADEGTSFKALVDETRLDLAQRYLTDESLSLAEIAFRLGFAEQSGFARAFRRWTAVTPSAYRESRRARRG